MPPVMLADMARSRQADLRRMGEPFGWRRLRSRSLRAFRPPARPSVPAVRLAGRS